MKKIASEELQKWKLCKVYAMHRLGTVPVGDESIVISVSASHRKAAFDACESILERVKEEVEIWKKVSHLIGFVLNNCRSSMPKVTGLGKLISLKSANKSIQPLTGRRLRSSSSALCLLR